MADATFAIAVIGAVIAALAAATAIWQSVLVRRQLESSVLVSRATFYQGVTRVFTDLDRIFLDRPEWRKYFYENKTFEGDDLQRTQLLVLAEFIVDSAETCTAAEEALPELVGDWDDFFNFLYKNSPTMRDYWAMFGHLYPPRVKRAIVGPSARPKNWKASSMSESSA